MSNLKNFLFTSESVSEGHPDKIADQIFAEKSRNFQRNFAILRQSASESDSLEDKKDEEFLISASMPQSPVSGLN